MPSQETWVPIESNWETIREKYPNPIQALADMRTPAVIIRQAYDSTHCAGLTQRFIDRELIPDQSVEDAHLTTVPSRRVDIGTSLAKRGNSPEDFFAHAQETHKLFKTLFDGFDNPVSTLYGNLARLAPGKRVTTAREPDARFYGLAIFRTYYGGQGHTPHFDSVRWRENRVNYDVYRFEHQLAGVICFQNSEIDGETAQSIIHRCLWMPEVDEYIKGERFHHYAAENHIENVQIDLEPGDLYFFNTRCIHEVPGVKGRAPRLVLAVFIGYSPDDEEVFVWS